LITQDVLRSLKIGRVFRDVHAEHDGEAPVVDSLDMHASEDLMVVAGATDTSICVYDLLEGKLKMRLSSRKYGCSCIRFTHHQDSVVYASSRGADHALRYHSLSQNKYVRYFRGHVDRVTGLAMSPVNDTMLSCSTDRSVLLWDIRADAIQGKIPARNASQCVCFDYQGSIFAVSTEPGLIQLFDMRKYHEGAFMNLKVNDATVPFSHISPSFDGKQILGVADSSIYVLDSFDGPVIAKINTDNVEGDTPQACFTPEGLHVISGCEDNTLKMWRLPETPSAAPQLVQEFRGHAGKPRRVAFSTQRLVMASACHAVALWTYVPS